MENELGFKVVSWCNYCHGGIYVGDPYSVDKKGNMYHDGCKEQKDTYYDSLDVGE